MLRKYFLTLTLFLFTTSPVLAHNKVGIHVLETAEVEQASKLVNSSGGDWGYITAVLRDNDMDQQKWQKFMDDCRTHHLIPIIRLATHNVEGGYWEKPSIDSLSNWVDFLNSLNWPVKQQIVAIFNEPNHATEWGGKVNPKEYAQVLKQASLLLKNADKNFFILPAGLDQAADGLNGTMKERVFLAQMINSVPDVFEYIDGWNTHSYPNHGFVGNPEDEGKGTIKGYQWEIEFLSNKWPHAAKALRGSDVYISETGWPCGRGYYIEDVAADYLEKAFQIWNADSRVKAVTPFVLNWQGPPLQAFSYINEQGQPKEKYKKVLGINKEKNLPEQIESYQVLDIQFGQILPTKENVKGKVKIRNTGQWIMGERKSIDRVIDIAIEKTNTENPEIYQGCQAIQLPKLNTDSTLVKPGEEAELEFEIFTGEQSAEYQLSFADLPAGKAGQQYPIYVFKPFDLKNEKISIWQQIKSFIRFRILS